MKDSKFLLLGLVLLVTFVSFIPSLGNDFTNWDDNHMVSANKNITRLSLKNIATIFSSRFVGTYVPLTILTYAVEYQFFGLKPRAYHTTNLILHLVNTAFVLLFFHLLTGNFTIAFVVSIMFGVHPLRVESVAWVTERKDVLCAFFYLASLILFVLYRKQKKVLLYITSLLLFLFSLLSKPMAVTLPLVLFLLDYQGGRGFSRALFLEKASFLALSVIFGVVNILTQGSLILPAWKYLQHFFIACHNCLFYLWKLALPMNLSGLYPYPDSLARAIPFDFLASPLILAALAGLIYVLGRSSRNIIFGGLFFALTILPVVQLVPLIAPAIAADRYTYLPALGVFYIIGVGFWKLNSGRPILRSAAGIILTATFVLIVAVLSVLTYQRCKVWKNSLALWNDVLEKYPNNAVAYNNRGRAYDTAGDYDKAIADYDRAVAIDPTDAIFYYNRGVSHSQLKNHEDAIADFGRATSIDPNLAVAYESRGAVHLHIGNLDRALEDVNRALVLAPHLAEAYYDRGFIHFKMDNKTMALTDLTRAIELDPRFAAAFLSRGDVHFSYSDYDRAIADYASALALDSLLVEAHYNRAVAYSRVGDLEHSLDDYNRALRLNPELAHAYNNRGNIYVDLGIYAGALADYNKALSLDTLYAAAYYNRAQVYFLTGEFKLALDDISRAGKLGFDMNPHLLKALRDSLKTRRSF